MYIETHKNFQKELRAENVLLGTFREQSSYRNMLNERLISHNDHIYALQDLLSSFHAPMVRKRYDQLWTLTELDGRLIGYIRDHLQAIKSVIEGLILQNEQLDIKRIAFRDELNKNQLKFGLSGLARSTVNTHIRENPSAVDVLGDFYKTILNEEPAYRERLGGSSKRNSSSRRKTRKRRQ
jgi:hypothetical protein